MSWIKRKYSPKVMEIKLQKLGQRIENHEKDLKALTKSHDQHIQYLGNFARHDIKNAILSIDAIIAANTPEEFTADTIQSLRTHVDVMRSTIDNLSKLIPYSINGEFTVPDLMIACELLTRHDLALSGVEAIFSYDRLNTVQIALPFHSVLQMMNNLIINAKAAMEQNEKKRIEIASDIHISTLSISISDNGEPILPDNASKIFDYGFSTRGGSGIGLYHAKYLCDKFRGSIRMDTQVSPPMVKTFKITLPVKPSEHEENSFDN